MSKHRRFSRKSKKAKNAYKFINKKQQLNIAKQNSNLKTAKQFVLNLSNRKLTNTEIMTLGKGLNFIPTDKISRTNILKKIRKKTKIKAFLS